MELCQNQKYLTKFVQFCNQSSPIVFCMDNNTIKFSLNCLINKVIKMKYKPSPKCVIYENYKAEDKLRVGRCTTYDIIGKRDYVALLNDEKYTF
ncbi:hypothetical protein AhnVgp041 [Adoxophyes honmai nucleopolyhedrovirus]|uniref:Uncharacterized protein n=1 Tax=Adoxophyes honmai nucleopolyhedrovirus TaxID=224399 RepID=Q80LQ5_NPVAH|nr:hypothetical protein AhnVgp041 [Adoxophyes honmai nucleopolyhedrovirus]BAC67292.1 hypothetical protein [Adoxophyes honmai nucleopolyhedrovirus]